MKFSIVYTVAMGFALGASAAAPISPHEGDVTHEQTSYDLYAYSKPGFRGEAVRLQANQCTKLKDNRVDVGSIKFTGNNCCMFFPTDDCLDPLGGQRVVGNVRDVKAWGFPRVGAVKCLSHSACEVLKHQKCDLDPRCGAAKEQGKCPFEPGCAAYHPVHRDDWMDAYRNPGAAVLERFRVDEHGAPVAGSRSGASKGPSNAPPAPRPLKDATVGGTDTYGRGPAGKKPLYPNWRDDRRARHRFRKIEKEKAKAAKKADKEAWESQQRAGVAGSWADTHNWAQGGN